MDIVKLKATIAEYDQQEKRMPVYECLKEAWASEPPSEELTVLAMAQMLLYVYRLEKVGYFTIVPEAPDEHDLYQAFLTEVMTYGFEHHRKGKMFLWELCRVLELWPMYYFKCKYVPEVERPLCDQLEAEGKALYPDSQLFDCGRCLTALATTHGCLRRSPPCKGSGFAKSWRNGTCRRTGRIRKSWTVFG